MHTCSFTVGVQISGVTKRCSKKGWEGKVRKAPIPGGWRKDERISSSFAAGAKPWWHPGVDNSVLRITELQRKGEKLRTVTNLTSIIEREEKTESHVNLESRGAVQRTQVGVQKKLQVGRPAGRRAR